MSISVVTVVLNSASDLPLTLESVRHQDYGDVEHILIDGGSYDGTAAVLDRYAPSIDKVVRVEDAGIYYAMNIALEHCRNEYVLFLNAGDTLFGASVLSRMMACKRSDVDVFFGNHVYVSGRREYFKRSIDYDISAQLLLRGEINHVWLSCLPGHQATFVSLALLRQLRFNTNIRICADHDLLMRAYKSGASFQFIDETVSHYVGGGFSAQRPEQLMLEWCSVYREHTLDPAAVDRFFLGEATPFDTQNALTGARVSGDHPREGPQVERGISKAINWCRPDGTQLRVPANGSTKLLRLEGYNAHDEQRLTFFYDDEEIGWIRVENGWFVRTVHFARLIPPLALVEIIADRMGEVSAYDRRVVGFGLSSFAFETQVGSSEIFRRGDHVAFSAKGAAITKRILAEGWAPQEEEFIWTVGTSADLRIWLGASVTSITFHCRGNPFIEDDDQRGFDMAIDGTFTARHLLPTHGSSEVSLDLMDIAKDHPVEFTLMPLARQSPPADHRSLGVCLLAIDVD